MKYEELTPAVSEASSEEQSRRNVLRTLGSAGVGSLALVGSSGVGAADHGGDWESQKEVHDEKSEWGDYGKLQLSTATALRYKGTNYDGNYAYHKMYFSTTSGTEWTERGEKADAIYEHSMTIDGSDPGFLSDIYDARTGISDTNDGSSETAEDLADLAKAAYELAEAPLSWSLDALETAAAFYDVFADDHDSIYVRGKNYDRDFDIKPHEAKHHGHFRIEVPKGESGWVTFDSSTRAYEQDTMWPADITVTNNFELWCDYDDVSIYEYRY